MVSLTNLEYFAEVLLNDWDAILWISDEMPTWGAAVVRHCIEKNGRFYPWGLQTADAVGAWWRESTPTMCCARVPDEVFDRLQGKLVGVGLGKGYESYREAWLDMLRVLFDQDGITKGS